MKKEKEHDVEEKKEEKKNVNVRKVDNNKKIDKTAIIKKTAKANTRAGSSSAQWRYETPNARRPEPFRAFFVFKY